MGVKLVVFNDAEPEIGVTFDWVASGQVPGKPYGWHGKCTQCGEALHFWRDLDAFELAQQHVDAHTT